MKKIFIIILLLVSAFAQAQTSVWDGSRQIWTQGTGTQEDPFLIESAANLAFLSYMVGKGFNTEDVYFALTTDIDLNGNEDQQWIPIGLKNDAYYEDGCERYCSPVGVDASDLTFKGHFDGRDHSIMNIYINKETGAAGLFGALSSVESQTVVENVFVTSGYIKAQKCGGIVGTCDVTAETDIMIARCWNGADIEGLYVGGIVGERADKIHNCYNVGSVNGVSASGGIAGSMATEVVECYNNGEVSSDSYSGGILGGSVRGNVDIRNCYNTGNVSSTGISAPSTIPGSPVGGIVGVAFQGDNIVFNCYNVGTVSCDIAMPGGVLGIIGSSGTVENVYYLDVCGGEGEGEIMTAEEMRAPAFVDALNLETNVWCSDTLNINDGYPILGANNLAVDESTISQLTVYPNPSHGKFVVEGTGELMVFNVLGQTVLTQEVKEQVALELPQGLYIIRLRSGETFAQQKLIVR